MTLRTSIAAWLHSRRIARVIALALLGTWGLLAADGATAAMPRTISFQGRLTDATTGAPVTAGPHTIQFTLYPAPDSPVALWTESALVSTDAAGLYTWTLGIGTAFPPELSFDQPYWLALVVDDGAELVPRYALNASPYAIFADTAQYARTASGGGGPSGWTWLITDGADSILQTTSAKGIARYGGTQYGRADSTHVNLGVICTTGATGFDYKYATVSGGLSNSASNDYATVGGGGSNVASGSGATVGGGSTNLASGWVATIGGGYANIANNNQTTVGGGYLNAAIGGAGATVGGGTSDTASENSATVGGGYRNMASGQYTTVGGGTRNQASGASSMIGGGFQNYAGGTAATVAGGSTNYASYDYGTVSGGYNNWAGDVEAVVGGGSNNIAQGAWSMVLGGDHCGAYGNFSLACGQAAKAYHPGAWVWADVSTPDDFGSTAANQFSVRAAGGTRIYSNNLLTAGVTLGPGAGAWVSVSDRKLKHAIVPLDGAATLAKVRAMPIDEWSYLSEGAVRHVGPMAQDFYAAFGLGADSVGISTIDPSGIALVAIQELARQNDALRKQVEALGGLRADVEALKEQNRMLLQRVQATLPAKE